MRTILRHGRILDPSQGIDMIGSVEIIDDQVTRIAERIDEKGADEIYDLTGLWITPGLVDLHAHLCEPGNEQKETILTGTQAAAAGGFTTICCTPDTSPPMDNPTLIDYILDQAASPESGGIFVAPMGSLCLDLKGRTLSDLTALKRAGIVAASDIGAPVQDSRMMRYAMELCLMLDLPVMCQCDDVSLSNGGVINEGVMSSMLGLKGKNRCAEEIMVARNSFLSLHTSCKVHLINISTWGSVEIVRQVKYLGAPVTCDVNPMHFVFTEEHIGEFNPYFKVDPPLRTDTDIDIILQGLKDGTIDAISSDHRPHATHEVQVPFDEAPFGVASLESLVGVTLTYLTHKNILTPLQTIQKLSTAPAEILKLEAGTLCPGKTPFAQVTVIDPNIQWVFDVRKTFSRGKNSPFDGMKLKGKAVVTFCGGEVYRDALFDESRYESICLC